MTFEGRVRRTKGVFLVLLGAVPVHLFLFGWSQLPQLNLHAFNSRLEERIELRGKMFDRERRPLALSAGTRRVYPQGELAAHWTGYHHSQRGMGGGERWKHELLRDRRVDGGREVLAGREVRFSLDVLRQQRLASHFPGTRGAALLVELTSGQILGGLSLPSYSPARAGAEWHRWQQDPAAPLLNRCTLGLYPADLLARAFGDRLGAIRQRPPALMDWTRPLTVEDNRILLSPAQVGAAILSLGTSLRLSQIYSEHRQPWSGLSAVRQRLIWVESPRGRSWAAVESLRSQSVTWALALKGDHLVVLVVEQALPLDKARATALLMVQD